MLELISGVIVSVAALALVIEPLVGRRIPAAPSPSITDVFQDPEESESPRVRALLALREIEFDREMGKISDEDYEGLRQRYGRAALDAMDAPEDGAGDDAVERAIASARSHVERACADCGERPELAAVYCSSCGRSLVNAESRPRCWMCGEELPDDARYCGGCGHTIAA